MTIEVDPWALVVLICWIAGTVESCLMTGVATALAMVSGEAPGSWALTDTVGKSTCGSAATGSWK